ncbi:cyclic nucleotide-binding domain-containing protein [Nisaea sp.]|uniref:Crp/Fnr family transcriptional regulator n=1 Tax=Nisaea sp. TaxID=2024842 RepID=UPI002B26649D|nr:cyclic nucleotide-binding domain-containing protein [Nisaea sp.]
MIEYRKIVQVVCFSGIIVLISGEAGAQLAEQAVSVASQDAKPSGADRLSQIVASWFLYAAFLPTVCLLAHKSFANQHEQDDRLVFPPRFLMRQGPYQIGLWLYVALAAGLFLALVLLDEFRGLLTDFLQYAEIDWKMSDDAEQIAVFTISFGITSLLLTNDFKINPFKHFRFIFCKLAAVPDRVDEIAHGLANLSISDVAGNRLINAAKISDPVKHVTAQELAIQNRNSPAYRWSMISHLYLFLHDSAKLSGNRSFFIDPNTKWKEVQLRYDELAGMYLITDKVRSEDADAWRGMLDALVGFQDRIVHLTAYFLISRSDKEEEIWAAAQALGAYEDEDRNFAPDPLNTVAALILTVSLTAFVGTLVGLMFLTWLPGVFENWAWGQKFFGFERFFAFEDWKNIDWVELKTPAKWGGFAVAVYIVPIVLMLGLKWIAFQLHGRVTMFRWRLLLVFVIVAYAGAVLGLVGMSAAIEAYQNGRMNFRLSVEENLLWGIAPALLTVTLIWVLHFIHRRSPSAHLSIAAGPFAMVRDWWSEIPTERRFNAGSCALLAGLVSTGISLAVLNDAPHERYFTEAVIEKALKPDVTGLSVVELDIRDRCQNHFNEKVLEFPRARPVRNKKPAPPPWNTKAEYCLEYTRATSAAMRIVVAVVSFFVGAGLFLPVFLFNIGLGHPSQSIDGKSLLSLFFGSDDEGSVRRVVLKPGAGKGATLFHEGDKADAAYLVIEGCLEVFRTVNGEERVIAQVGPDNIIGEYALVMGEDNPNRSASVRAVEPSVVVHISASRFKFILENMEPTMRRLVEIIVRREVELTRKFSESEAGAGL